MAENHQAALHMHTAIIRYWAYCLSLQQRDHLPPEVLLELCTAFCTGKFETSSEKVQNSSITCGPPNLQKARELMNVT